MSSFACQPKKHKASLIGPVQKKCVLELTMSSAISLHRQTKVGNELMTVLCVMWLVHCEGASDIHQVPQQLDSDRYWHIYLFIFYIPWIFRDKPHLGIGIVNIDMNTLYNVMMCML